MRNETKRGRAQLRDMGPAEGIYEVEYIIHTGIQNIKHIGLKPITHKIFTADIRLINGYSLKNGNYVLEQEGKAVCQLRKNGSMWHLHTEDAREHKGKRK